MLFLTAAPDDRISTRNLELMVDEIDGLGVGLPPPSGTCVPKASSLDLGPGSWTR